MKPTRKKRYIRNISLGMAAMVLLAAILSSQPKVVQAKEVFLKVQELREEVIQTTKAFTILEIVDQTFDGSLGEDGRISSLTPGEEEIGYLIGGEEPYDSFYGTLWEKSRQFSKISWLKETGTGISIEEPSIENQDNIKESYNRLVYEVNQVFTGQTLIADIDTDENTAPMKKIEATSYIPNPLDYEECLRIVEKVSDITGYLVEDPNGAYIDGSGYGKGYLYVGALDENTNVIFATESTGEPSLSDNDLGEGSVSDNEIMDPGSISDNEIKKEDPKENEQPQNPEGGSEQADPQQPPNPGSGNEQADPQQPPNPGSGNEQADPQQPPNPGSGNEQADPQQPQNPEGGGENESEKPEPLQPQEAENEEAKGIVGREKSLCAITRGYGTQVYALSERVSATRYSFYEDLPQGYTQEQCIHVTTRPGEVTETTKKIEAVYQFTFLGIDNNQWFKKHVFGLEKNPNQQSGERDFQEMKIEVLTCTPSSLELAQNLEKADMVYWNADLKDRSGNPTEDISLENAILILEAVTGSDSLPCIINDSAYKSLNPDGNPNSSSNAECDNKNGNKLLHILYQEKVKEVYDSYQLGRKENWTNEDNTDNDMLVMECWKTMHEKILASDSTAYINKGHFVRNNLYVIHHALCSVSEKLQDTIITASQEEQAAIDLAFEEVDYRVEQEEYERQQAGAATWPTSEKRTPALAIQTILTYTPVPAVIEKSQITVLELQPCDSFDYVDQVDAFKEKFLPEGSTTQVTIVGMTTSEFCGKLEDINVEYDMIYLGSNTGRMNTVGSGEDVCTAYNDLSMYGIVYSHIGDLCIIRNHSGLLSQNENDVYRYSGNDILEEQKKAFLDFLESGAPIVAENDFFLRDEQNNITGISTGVFTRKENGAEVEVTVEDEKRGITGIKRMGILDSSTYLYQFIKEACGNENVAYGETGWSWEKRKYPNLLTVDTLEKRTGKEDFFRWLNQPKMSLHLLRQPVEYNYTTRKVGNYSVIADSSYLQKEGDAYYLTYEFYISSLASVDVNSTFYKVSLYVDSNMDGKYSKSMEDLSDSSFEVINLETGEKVGREQLRSGVYYQIKKALPYDAVGALPWKLVVENTANASIRTAVTGMTAVRMPEKQHVRILQLYQGDSNIEQKMKEPGNVWNVLLNNVPDFEVQITSIDAASYLSGTQKEKLENYDMLIVGFADAYQIRNSQSEDQLKEIVKFAESGKCVLFSHDNTNWNNGRGENTKLNMYIRNLTGLDRYGTTLFRVTDQEKYQQQNLIKNGGNVTAASREELIQKLFGPLGMEYKRDVAFAINSDQKEMDSRTQGLTYSGNEHDRITNEGRTYQGKEIKDIYRYLDFQGVDPMTWINQNAHEVEKVNQGAITEYPYRLSQKISIAPTHAQYYQLDLESDQDEDGEGDIVVWYTLSSSKKGDENDVYDFSPRDVRNNYYIYNRGNITYTGMGHKTIQNEEEIKLFINTMIAAYRVSIQSPSICVIEGKGDDTKKSFDAIPMDSLLEETVQTYPVYFKIEDKNMVSDALKQIRVKVYLEGGTESLTIEEETIEVTDKTMDPDWKVYEAATETYLQPDKGGYYTLKAGTEYFVSLPLKEEQKNLSEYKSLDLYLSAQTFITKKKQGSESAIVYTSFKLTQINLFDLD